jgi:hypothetical protein
MVSSTQRFSWLSTRQEAVVFIEGPSDFKETFLDKDNKICWYSLVKYNLVVDIVVCLYIQVQFFHHSARQRLHEGDLTEEFN